MPPDAAGKPGLTEAPPPGAAPGEVAPTPADAHKEFDIDIYRAWCKKCGICKNFCPRGCISLDEEGRPVVTRPERCTGCGWCELHCPDFAISVRERLKGLPKEEAD